jgi:predicted permease
MVKESLSCMMAGLAELGAQIAQDLRYAWRSFRSSPGFSLAALLTIGLGVGVNTGIFSIVNSVAFGDIPAADPGELVAINQDVQGVPRGQNNGAQFSYAEFETYRERITTLSGVLAYGRLWAAFLGRENARPVIATPVSCNYFDVLGRPTQIGGGFNPAHCVNPADAAVTVITHELWMNEFGSDPNILDRTLTANGSEFRIVGVAPAGFAGIDIDKPVMFVPLEAQGLLRPDRAYLETDSIAWLNLVGRRAPGVEIEQVQAELAVIARQFDLDQAGRMTTISVDRATAISSPGMRAGILGVSAVLMVAFGLVLLVACTNVANLMLARADARMRETAIRLSLGATRRRLIRQFVTESLFVSLAGGMLGAILAVWSFKWLVVSGLAALPSDIGTSLRIEPEADLRVLAFAVVVSTLAGVGFGLMPALTATRPALRMTIDQGLAGGASRSRGRLQGALVGTQVAFSMVLVVATALLIRGFFEARNVDPAFDHEVLTVAASDLRGFGFDAARAAGFFGSAIAAVRGMPGVEDVAQALYTPLAAGSRTIMFRRPEVTDGDGVQTNIVSANYFAVTGIPIVRGRPFTEAEVAADPLAAVILTESTARSFWPDEDPIGKTLVHEGFVEATVEVVGIARDIEVATIGETATRYIYTPATPSTQPQLQLVVRSILPAEVLRDGITAVFNRLDPNLPVQVGPLSDNFAFWARISALASSLAAGLGLLALILASVGVFGVMTTVVGRRVREIGIRLALGARKGDVLKLMLKKSMRPVVIGAVVGVLACFGVAELLSALLFGVGALDPIALGGAAAAVLGAGLLASAIPVRRAMSVDPMTTLRYE